MDLKYTVRAVSRKACEWLFLEHHYAKRLPPVSFAFGLYEGEEMVGAVSFGVPASRHLQMGVCPSNPAEVLELNRLCVLDCAGRNTESWFLSRVFKLLPPRIVVSYADTTQGHLGYVYRASNFYYAGWTDMDRKTPRYDYLVPGKHSREAFRGGEGTLAMKVRRKPKVKYWTLTGDSRDKKRLMKLCQWPQLNWKDYPPPTEHLYMKL
jgi:hypothetical protein